MDLATLLTEVKARLAITDEYHDPQLLRFINDVVFYLKSSGITEEILSTDEAYGVIFRGVADLWNNEPGNAKFSNIFRERAIQLMAMSAEGEV